MCAHFQIDVTFKSGSDYAPPGDHSRNSNRSENIIASLCSTEDVRRGFVTLKDFLNMFDCSIKFLVLILQVWLLTRKGLTVLKIHEGKDNP